MIEAFLIFLPTTIFGNMVVFVFAAIYMFIKNQRIHSSRLLQILFVIIGLSLCNFIFSINDIDSEYSGSVLTIFPYSLFLILTYIIASNLNERILKYLLMLIFLEIIVGVFEYLAGVTSFFNFGQTTLTINMDDTLLYYRRVFGLSLNSSDLAIKVLIALMLIFRIKDKLTSRFFFFSFLLCLIGIYITFNRTVILCMMIFLFFFYFKEIKERLSDWRYVIGVVIMILIVSGLIILNWKYLVFQFVRGNTGGDVTALMGTREDIFTAYVSYIIEHFWGGNGSSKYWLSLNGCVYHAHNSFLMTLAANGVLISILYFSILFLGIKKNATFPYIAVFICVSILQYGVFWGISFLDIFLFYIILSPQSKLKRIQYNDDCFMKKCQECY